MAHRPLCQNFIYGETKYEEKGLTIPFNPVHFVLEIKKTALYIFVTPTAWIKHFCAVHPGYLFSLLYLFLFRSMRCTFIHFVARWLHLYFDSLFNNAPHLYMTSRRQPGEPIHEQ